MEVTARSDRDSQKKAPARRRGLVFGTSTNFAAQLLGAGSTALLGIVVARSLGPSGTGTYSLLSNLSAALILIAGFGLTTGITIEVGRGRWPFASVLTKTQLAGISLGIIGTLLGFGLYLATSNNLFRNIGVGLVLAPLISVPFGLACNFSGAVAVAKQLYSKYALITLSNPLLTLICAGTAAALWGITGAVIGSAAGTTFSALIAVNLLRHDREHTVGRSSLATLDHAQEDGSHLRKAFSLGFRGWGGDLLQFFNYRLDLFVVAAYASRGSLGQYYVAVSVTGLGWLLPNAVASVFMPRVASLDAASKRGEISPQAASQASARMVRHSVLVQIPTVICLSAALLLLPLFFGPGFRPAIGLGFYLVPGVVALGITKVLGAAIVGRGHTIYSLYSALLTAPPTIGLYFALIPKWGATGGAVASSVSYMFSTALGIYFFRRADVAPLSSALIPRRTELEDYWQLIRRIALIFPKHGLSSS